MFEILLASTYAGYIEAASTAEMKVSKPGLKHITSPPTFVNDEPSGRVLPIWYGNVMSKKARLWDV